MSGTIHGSREDLKSMFGEGFHTALRKGTEAPGSSEMHRWIANLPEGAWNGIIEFVVWGMEYSKFLTWDAETPSSEEER